MWRNRYSGDQDAKQGQKKTGSHVRADHDLCGDAIL
jgi:hypothetical protein